MSISLNTVEDLQEHLLGVFERSAHHAGEVNEVLLTLIGAMLWRKSPGDVLKVNTKEGAGGNVIWFKVDGSRYVLLYSHEDRHIKLMAGGRKGDLLHTFTNDNTAAEVSAIFAQLGQGTLDLSAARKVRKEDREPGAPKDPAAKAARQAAKASKRAAGPEAKLDKPEKPARDKQARLDAKAAKQQARDAKVTAQRAQRRADRAEAKAAKAQAQGAQDAAMVPPVPGQAADQAVPVS